MFSLESMRVKFLILVGITIILFALNIFIGSVDIPSRAVWQVLMGEISDGPIRYIVLSSRLPQAITAILAGAALTVAGLLLQTAFRNPLAGPSVLGITSGGSLGVALVVLFFGGSVSAAGYSWDGYMAILMGAFLGSVGIMFLLLLFSVWLKNDMLLLIVGILVGYFTSSIITLLNFVSTAEGVQGYMMWGMGNFNGVSMQQLPLFGSLVGVGLIFAILMIKPLNVILLGENYAQNLGMNMHRVRNMLLLSTGVLTAVVTAYCGPVAFIGLAVPHIVRMIFRTANHSVIIPGCIVTGAAVGLLCCLLCVVPKDMVWPLNGVTPLIGVPVIMYVILKGRGRR